VGVDQAAASGGVGRREADADVVDFHGEGDFSEDDLREFAELGDARDSAAAEDSKGGMRMWDTG
jgi:hypothetical protein